MKFENRVLLNNMATVKFLLFELIKCAVAVMICALLFTVIPLTTLVLLLPVDILVWVLLRSRWSASTRIGVLALLYIVLLIAAFTWIVSGNSGLEFLLDFNSWD